MKKLKLLMVVPLFFVFTALSCEKDEPSGDSGLEYIDQDLAGKIGGNDWTIVSGTVTLSSGNLTFILYKVAASAGDPCGLGAYSGPNETAIFIVNDAIGTYNLGSTQVTTLFDGSTNYIAMDGFIELTIIDKTTIGNKRVEGKLVADYNNENYVTGNFTATYCS